VRYADICFSRFGDQVKHWVIFNEPWITASYSHGLGLSPRERTSPGRPVAANAIP
jgi:beta-glucosidase